MKTVALTTLVIAAALSVVPAFAQDKMDSMKGMSMAAMPASGAQVTGTHSATGVVKKIDAKSGAVTFAH